MASKNAATAAGPARDARRRAWFGRYPAAQTCASFALALLATAALSIDPTNSSHSAIQTIDPTATGALYICYEILLSFPGHEFAVLLLAFACLLVLPIRYVMFGRRDSWRPSVVIPALAFAACMVFGKSYDTTDSAQLALGGTSRVIESLIAGAGWTVLAHVGIYLVFSCFDWFGSHRTRFSESRYGRMWRAAHALLDRHPFVLPWAAVAIAWAPTFIASVPGLFMGDTGAQIRQWFNLPNGTSDYLNLINPNVLLNGHHPVVHTALLGGCVQLGISLFGNENAGVLLYTTLQFAVTTATVAYVLSSLYHMGAGLAARMGVLAFFIFVPIFSNYAVLITKDVLFGDAFVLLVVQMAKLLVPAGGTSRQREEGANEARRRRKHGSGRDWALLVLASLGCAFLRNGGLVFPAIACILIAGFRIAAHRRRAAAAALGVLAVTAAAYLAFTGIAMPALDITPGSKREALSIPFQQTARYVLKHDGVHAGVEGGSDDGMVSDEERAIIDRVLDYDTLASRYDPDKSDSVKNAFNEDATAEDLAAYFRVWATQFLRDPASYASAFANNYFGYFYPSQKDVWVYSTVSSDKTMARPENRDYFDFHRSDSAATDICNHLTTLYRVAIQRIPLVSLTMSSSMYVWLLIVCAVYLLRNRRWPSLALFAPLLAVLAVCLIGPCNGSTYMRYLYPMICACPFAMVVALGKTRPAPSA